ncbi:MAG: hypothetical protein WAS27_01065 [Candidatus Saccharimonadales bacterium]
MSMQGEQLAMPLDVRVRRDVQWYVMEQEQRQRRCWFGKKVIERHIETDEWPYLAIRKMAADDISTLEDSELKNALRLQDAANANGWIDDGHGASHSQFVEVYATDNGTDSRFVRATYSGVDDSFMNDLQLAAPKREDNSTF